jgi:hypothetical protein
MWFIQSKVPKSRIDEYFASGLDITRSASFKSAYTLEKHLKNLDPLSKYPEWTEGIVEDRNHTICFFYRNIIDCVRYLITQIAHKDSMAYAPVKEYDQVGAQLYSEMHTAQWWWEIQVNSTTRSRGMLHILTKDFEETLPRGATVVPIIGMSDQTHLSNFSGDKKAWPVYVTIGNINSKTRNSPTTMAILLLALLPVPPKFTQQSAAADDRQRQINADSLQGVF